MAHIPEEPSSDSRALARLFRDQYAALKAEGFTETQALQLVSNLMKAFVIASHNGGSDNGY